MQIYFCKFIIDPYLEDPELSQYIDKARLERFWTVGGVRIEDNVHILKDGYENLTTTPKEYVSDWNNWERDNWYSTPK